MRLIDADAISIKPIDASSLEFDAGILSVLHHIDKMPTIDPVKHGEWVPTDSDDTWECLVCGSLWTFIEGTPKDNGANYCPNCGASMDMGDE